jgi:RHS repeat-associated protein
VTDPNGEVYERLEYTPYGETWLDETSGDTYFDTPYRFRAKEKDEARTIAGVLCVGLYYYGARYLDPKYSRWISADPALGEYLPQAPVNDEAKKHNQSLPGQGGVFNVINLNLYHYAGNNPIKYTDPDGNQVAVTPYGPILVPVLPMHPIQPTKPLQPSSPSNGRILGDDLLMSDTKKSNDGDTSSSQADQAKAGLESNVQANESDKSLKNNRTINPDDIDMKDTNTWPKPPVDGPTKEGEPSREKQRNRGEKSLYDKNGGEWRVHKTDKYHQDWHWDYKAPSNNGTKNTPWKDVNH